MHLQDIHQEPPHSHQKIFGYFFMRANTESVLFTHPLPEEYHE